MDSRIRITFLILVLVQAMHSIEEYFGKLWEVFEPARLMVGLVSRDPEKGFLIINICLFVFGILCLFILKQRNDLLARGLVWIWIAIELVNGIGHPIWSIYIGAYHPGVATAPLLLILAIYLSYQLTKKQRIENHQVLQTDLL